MSEYSLLLFVLFVVGMNLSSYFELTRVTKLTAKQTLVLLVIINLGGFILILNEEEYFIYYVLLYLFALSYFYFSEGRKEIMKIGRKYLFSVAEPWDFTSSEGDNLFSGTIVDIINNEVFLIKVTKTFILKELPVNYLVAFYRHRDVDSNNFKLFFVQDSEVAKFNVNSLAELKTSLKFIIIAAVKNK